MPKLKMHPADTRHDCHKTMYSITLLIPKYTLAIWAWAWNTKYQYWYFIIWGKPTVIGKTVVGFDSLPALVFLCNNASIPFYPYYCCMISIFVSSKHHSFVDSTSLHHSHAPISISGRYETYKQEFRDIPSVKSTRSALLKDQHEQQSAEKQSAEKKRFYRRWRGRVRSTIRHGIRILSPKFPNYKISDEQKPKQKRNHGRLSTRGWGWKCCQYSFPGRCTL